MNGLKQRAKTLLELCDISTIYTDNFMAPEIEKSSLDVLTQTLQKLEAAENWTEESLEISLRSLAAELGISFGKIAQPLRNVLTGKKITPSIFEMLCVFGKEESIARLKIAVSIGICK
jgi:glutamyl-tRNA synthetase